MASTSTAADEHNILGKCIVNKYVVLKQIGQGGFGRVYLPARTKYVRGQRLRVKIEPEKKWPQRADGTTIRLNPKAGKSKSTGTLPRKRDRRCVKILERLHELDGTVLHRHGVAARRAASKDYVTIAQDTRWNHSVWPPTFLLQLADALRLMHFKKIIVTRDLTASKCADPGGFTGPKRRRQTVARGKKGQKIWGETKITDFGLSKRDVHGQLRTMLGTPAFMAPEVRAGKYTMSADVFSLGSIFFLLLTRKYLPGANQMAMPSPADEQQKRMGNRIQQKQQQLQQQYLDLECIWNNVWSKNESVRALYPPTVHASLKSFMVGLLCREDNRIMLDEIECCDFIKWYRLNRPVLDPEMDELCCSASLSGTPAGTRDGRAVAAALARVLHTAEVPPVNAAVAAALAAAGGGAGGADFNNRDSALGSDNPTSRSGTSRCRHPQIDADTGRCRTCSYRPTSSTRTATATASLMDSGRPMAVASTRALQPHSVRFEQTPLPHGTRPNNTMGPPSAPTAFSAPAIYATNSNSRRNTNATIGRGGGDKENIVPSTATAAATMPRPSTATAPCSSTARCAMWPLPSTVHLQKLCGHQRVWPGESSSLAVTECRRHGGRMEGCTFRRPASTSAAALPLAGAGAVVAAAGDHRHNNLCVILEKTRSKLDTTVECVAELWRTADGTAQEFRLYEPVQRHLPCPARNDQLVAKAELLARIRSADELAQNRMARAAYDTLCSFYKLAESKINQAYVEEIVDERKWRLELRWNGFINVYEGPRTARELELKLVARQKTEWGPFDEVKGADPLSRADRSRLDELASLLRTEVNKSVWRRRQFDSDLAGGAGGGGGHQQPRNLRCTIYTRGYT
ncbi:hypothetical protein niasHT_003465 [Heterodera trifolii]|uniref:non-specific serine/threonine protein kinase n=1 Tax=Heterodera trifolii TaxID=157864 RepID=A0ABD2M1Z8_9BILA